MILPAILPFQPILDTPYLAGTTAIPESLTNIGDSFVVIVLMNGALISWPS